MAELRIDFEWTDPMGARGAELRATWGRLRLSVDDHPVTLLADRENRALREGVDLPPYPVAEWITTHWWFLFSEVETPGKIPLDEYEHRHNLRYAQEGFALPDLSFRPIGSRVQLDWSPCARPHQRLEFIAHGSGFVATAELRQVLGEFVTAVVRRLDDQEIRNTLLQQDWAAITAIDPEEAEFCQAAASLGIDPFAASDAEIAGITEVAAELPASLRDEFFNVARADRLIGDAESVLESLRVAETNPVELGYLQDVRRGLHVANLDRLPPWVQGYKYAQAFRHALGLDGAPVIGNEGLSHALHIEPGDFPRLIARREHPSTIDAVLAFNEVENPGFAIGARSEEALRFAFCRALFEFLASRSPEPRLVTHAHSEQQKRNRAFAAEFFIPAESLRDYVVSDVMPETAVDELAQELQVSPFVVRHQLENHGIARVQPA